MADYNTGIPAEADALLAQMMDEASVTAEAHERFTETDAYQAALRSKYQRLHFFYQPLWNGDQWPEDMALRPGKIHITNNIIKPAVNIDARLQSLIPRLSLKPDGYADEQRGKAEAAEKLMLEWLDMSGWDVWMGTLCRVKSLYGKGVLKVFWNKEDKRPDVRVVENPANLRIGWGSSDFSVMDWALYEYAISPLEAMRRFPGLNITSKDGGNLQISVSGDHGDPLTQKPPLGDTATLSRPVPYQPSDYEQKQVRVWDYWYKKPKKGGFTVCNAMFIEGHLVCPEGGKMISEHAYLPDIPYIVVPQDIEPGNPEGLSSVEDLIDIQIELNRAITHWAQLVADEVDPAWVAEGENTGALPPGIVPKAGQIVGVGDNKVHALEKGINVFPIESLMGAFWDHYHKISGLSEILFGQVPGAQTSGRAVAIQVEAAANRLDPRRRLLYGGLKELLIFWTIMAEKINPKVPAGVDKETGLPRTLGLKDIIGGFRRWRIVAPEITPRDIFENTTNEIQKVQARISSRETAMDALGQDSPMQELERLRAELMDAQLNPEAVQAYTALLFQMQQMQVTQQQMQQQLGAVGQQAGPQGQQPTGQPPGGAVAQGETAVNAIQQQQYQGQPGAVGEDQNQPMTQAGAPPPGNGQGPSQQQVLIRDGQALNQIAIR